MKLKFSFLLVLTLLIVNSSLLLTHATIRFVSKSGTSTPPYTSWETAADSIQKCIDYSVDGDTIIVSNGVYKELILINKNLSIYGLNMDSTVLDSRGLIGTGTDSSATILVHGHLAIKNFYIIGDGKIIIYGWFDSSGMIIDNCRIENGSGAVVFSNGINKAENLIIRDVSVGISTGDLFNTASYETKNNLIITEAYDGYGIFHSGGGTHEITNNIILYTNSEVSSAYGIKVSWGGRMIIKNNIVAGFDWGHFYQDEQQLDSAFIINNVFGYSSYNNTGGQEVIVISDGRKIFKNNMVVRCSTRRGVRVYNYTLNPNYNLYWDLLGRYQGLINPGENEIGADPMFVKDTIPNNQLNFDYHLQAFSPAIDAGDPNILDVDSSPSDIGAYGGEGGQSYNYLNLPPRAPVNLDVMIENKLITLTWNRNSEADTSYYNVYMDTVANFTIDSTKLIASPTDTIYIVLVPEGVESLYFKITCVDSEGNESLPSAEVGVLITSVNDYKVIADDYLLYQNYPNPFNPSTKIGYKLRGRSYVVLKIYDIKGELVQVLVNKEQEAGYYEVEFYGKTGDPFPGMEINLLASGIYLYRIEVTGEGNIPVYSETKKMLFLK